MQLLMRWNYYRYQAFLIKSYKLLNKTELRKTFQETKQLQYRIQVFVFINTYIHIYTNKRTVRDKIAFLYTKERNAPRALQTLPFSSLMQLL